MGEVLHFELRIGAGSRECRNSCKLTVGSYAKFSNDIKASDLTVEISSGASVGIMLTADALTMRIDSYAKFSGTVTADPAGEADRQQRRLVQRNIQRQFA